MPGLPRSLCPPALPDLCQAESCQTTVAEVVSLQICTQFLDLLLELAEALFDARPASLLLPSPLCLTFARLDLQYSIS